MKLSLIKAGPSKKYIVQNLYPLYLHDMAEIWDIEPNRHGIFEDDDSNSLESQFQHFNVWWSDNEIFFPYLIYLEDVPVGFALVAKAPYCPKKSEVCLHEFFILRPYRRRGLGKTAAKLVFDEFRGEWSFYTNPTTKNYKVQEFWRGFLDSYLSGKYREILETTESDLEVLAFRFNTPPSD